MSFPASTAVHEAYGKRGALPARLQGLTPATRLTGPAFPVSLAPGDNFWLHRGLEAAPAGAVLVAAVGGAGADATEFGYWGELMTAAAVARRLTGLVIDGGVRDVLAVVGREFPVFCRGAALRGTTKSASSGGSLGAAIVVGDVEVAADDLVVGDRDGVVVVAADEASAVLERARQREEWERGLLPRIEAGESPLGILGAEER